MNPSYADMVQKLLKGSTLLTLTLTLAGRTVTFSSPHSLTLTLALHLNADMVQKLLKGSTDSKLEDLPEHKDTVSAVEKVSQP